MNSHEIYLQQAGLKSLGFDPGPLDGEDGPRTQQAKSAWISSTKSKGGFADRLVMAAISQVGNKEEGDNGGSAVRMYQAATDLKPGSWPWCAAFVCWCVAQAANAATFKADPPETPGAWDFERWARDNADKGVRIIKPAIEPVMEGDIVVYAFSHIGIAVAREMGGVIKTVEGNTNSDGEREGDGVYRKTRKKSLVRSIIRISN